MIDHDAARALAAQSLDFDLSAEDDGLLLAHVVGCDDCRAFAEALDLDAAAIAALASTDAPAELRASIVAMLPSDPVVLPGLTSAPTLRPAMPSSRLATIQSRYRGPFALTAAAAVVVALVGGMLVWRPAPEGLPGVAHAGQSGGTASGSGTGGSAFPGGNPTAVPGSAATLEPTVQPGSRLAATPWTQVAEVTADDGASGIVGLASGFRLKMLDGTSAIEAARRLEVDPPIAFTTAAAADGTVAITPSEPLAPGAAYRFRLTSSDGHEVGTWAFQSHQPLRVVGTVPEDTESGVPLDTGIEVQFDQDGVVDAESHITMDPPTKGRFEQHGRTIAFVPASPLSPATIYTVTVSPGVAVGATDERLEGAFTYRFETVAAGATTPTTTFQFSDDLFESATADAPIIAVWAFQDTGDEDNPPPPPTNAPLEVYRIDGIAAAEDAYRAIRSHPRWTMYSATEPVPTGGLTRILSVDARLRDSDGVLWTELPERLPAGWYLVRLPSPTRPIEAMLQVTDIASYLVVSETSTLLWANDLATHGPLAGASVGTTATSLGRTGTDGTLVATTPSALKPEPLGSCASPCLALMTVTDGERAAIVPASALSEFDGKDVGWRTDQDDGAHYWRTLLTDRLVYRSTDTVNAWGVIRDRDSGKVPDEVTLELSASDGDTGEPGPAIDTKTAHPNAFGAFTGSLSFDLFPTGTYELQLRTGGRLIASTTLEIDRILKPAYRIDVTTGHHVYLVGDKIHVTARATFYEGTPVPGITLRGEGITSASFTTDATGTASRKTTARIKDQDDGGTTSPEIQEVTLRPATTEEGEITSASREIVVYPSQWTIAASATTSGGRARVRGTLSEIARDRLEREVAGGADPWSLDPAGKAMPGRTVTVSIDEITPIRTKTGTRYDFVEKKVVPVYEYRDSVRLVDTVRVRTDDKGRFSASTPAQPGHGYRIHATATDPDGHVTRWFEWAQEPDESGSADPGPVLALTNDPAMSSGTFSVGDTIDIRMSDRAAASEAATDRYLFTTAQRGLRDVVVQDSPRFRSTFDGSARPNVRIDAVRFNGSRYSATTSFEADFKVSDRALTVALSTDAARYAPGGDVHIAVKTSDRSGHPVASTVVLRAVDAKLFALGAAAAADPLNDLYAATDAGIGVIYRSHRLPRGVNDEGGGDTTGGGRDDFRDALLFKSVETGSDGRASVTMHLSDDLTSWLVSASALGADLSAGEGSTTIPVGLPFFVDATLAPEYLVSDRPDLGLRAFGTALDGSTRVTFSVRSDSLGLQVDDLVADAFKTVRVPLPRLSLGRHEITITARTGSGAGARVDRVTRTITVVASRLERTRTTSQAIDGVTHVEGGSGMTEVTVSDAGVGRYAGLLLGLTDTESGRLENALAATVAGSLAQSRFAATNVGDPATFDGDVYQADDGGLSLVAYGSSDLEASVLVALVAPERFDRTRLREYLTTIAHAPAETRERRVFAFAGLAGLRAAVLPDIRAAASDPDLTVRERLLLGIGAATLGDGAHAHKIEAALTDGYGEAAADGQARLRVGKDVADTTQATALMAILAAANDDPLAGRFWAYVDANPDENAT
ncbi:MAG: Ig-like domain-containing protein, partial [Chloroflexota bacterium]